MTTKIKQLINTNSAEDLRENIYPVTHSEAVYTPSLFNTNSALVPLTEELKSLYEAVKSGNSETIESVVARLKKLEEGYNELPSKIKSTSANEIIPVGIASNPVSPAYSELTDKIIDSEGNVVDSDTANVKVISYNVEKYNNGFYALKCAMGGYDGVQYAIYDKSRNLLKISEHSAAQGMIAIPENAATVRVCVSISIPSNNALVYEIAPLTKDDIKTDTIAAIDFSEIDDVKTDMDSVRSLIDNNTKEINRFKSYFIAVNDDFYSLVEEVARLDDKLREAENAILALQGTPVGTETGDSESHIDDLKNDETRDFFLGVVNPKSYTLGDNLNPTGSVQITRDNGKTENIDARTEATAFTFNVPSGTTHIRTKYSLESEFVSSSIDWITVKTSSGTLLYLQVDKTLKNSDDVIVRIPPTTEQITIGTLGKNYTTVTNGTYLVSNVKY